MPPEGTRTVEVLPPSRRDEAVWVLLTAAFVVLCVIYAVAFARGARGGAETTSYRALLPYQVLFRDLPKEDQRVFRQMQEGATELIAERGGSSGTWPAADELAADGIPPFAADDLDGARRAWQLRGAGLLYQYVGVPAQPASAAPAFMISILEPDPVTGEKVSPVTPLDEEHKLLPDGTLLHVTYWKRTPGPPPGGVFPDPARAGWTQIRLADPFEEAMRR